MYEEQFCAHSMGCYPDSLLLFYSFLGNYLRVCSRKSRVEITKKTGDLNDNGAHSGDW